jgi:outer membrane protein assembly factor BamB
MRKRNSKNIFAGLFFIAALLIVAPIVHLGYSLQINASSAGPLDEWPMFRHDQQHTGYSPSAAPSTNTTKWFYNVSTAINSAPAVANDRVIIGISNGNVLAINSTTGEKLWSYYTSAGANSIWSSPAIDSGKVYIGVTRDHSLYCLNESTGMLLWSFETGNEIASSPLVSNGKVYFGSSDGNLYCLNTNDGSLAWNFTSVGLDFWGDVGGIDSSPAISGNIVFVGSRDANLYALNAITGVEIWHYTARSDDRLTDAIFSSPTVYDDDVFFNNGNKLYCLNAATGTLVWKTSGAINFGGVYSSPAVANGRVFIGDNENTFYCFNASAGSSIWNLTNVGPVVTSPAIADGKVYFGAANGRVYCLTESTGAEIWRYRTIERIWSSPAIANGTVFIGCGDDLTGVGGLYAFGEKYSLPTSLSLQFDSQTALLGFKVNLTGTLKGNNIPIAGASIVLSYKVTEGQQWNDITSVPTNANGDYSAIWQPSATGTYLVKATWTSYYPYEKGEVSRMLSVNTFDGQTVFSVTSNSTVSALAFNSTSKELSFTVTGTAGTTGFVDVTIAKSLVANIADLKVYVDGASINYVATSTTDSWLLHFTYTHSTHVVVVNLGATVIPEFPTWAILLGFTLAMMFAMLIKKKGLEPKPKRAPLRLKASGT